MEQVFVHVFVIYMYVQGLCERVLVLHVYYPGATIVYSKSELFARRSL